MPEFLVTFKNAVYNINTFLDKHPGGRDILEEYQDRDITDAFYDYGHSVGAEKLLRKYKLHDEGSIVSAESNTQTSSASTDVQHNNPSTLDAQSVQGRSGSFVMAKLFTKEDPFNIHKLLGGFALVHFAYRYYHLLVYGHFGFQNDLISYTTLGLHLLLSYSSFIFTVLKHRSVANPLIIYEEYRLHAMLFSTRAIGISILGLLRVKSYVVWLFMLCIHILVDQVTLQYGTKGVTAVRISKDFKDIQYLRLFFSYYQFLAIGCHLISGSSLIDLGFNTVIAIQSSAFLMTLKRKGLIKWYTYAFWYLSSLILSMYGMTLYRSTTFFVVILFLFSLRVKFNVNKYVLWSAFVMISCLSYIQL